MINYKERALEFGKKESDSIEILMAYESDEYLIITLVTPELIKAGSALDYYRYAVNRKTDKEYFGKGFGFLQEDGFENVKISDLIEIDIDES